MIRLDNASLSQLTNNVEIPGYDRSKIKLGIVHIGLGAFHRAHQALVIDDCLRAGYSEWGIIAASLRGSATRDALAPQDMLYTVVINGCTQRRHRVIGAIIDAMVAPENPTRLVDSMSDPNIRIVTLTITEKGYLRNSRGDLDLSLPELLHDFANPLAPVSVYGFLALALLRRKQTGALPFTILSCDNIPANGAAVKTLLGQYIERVNPALANYVRDYVMCPSTMVDRIVPATTDEDRRLVAIEIGATDASPVFAEDYLSWVIEDNFPAGRPPFCTTGVQLVRDVKPFELMKIRLLNGAHSAIAYSGLLLNCVTVSDAFANPLIKGFATSIWREAIPTITNSDVDLGEYVEQLAARFANTRIKHKLEQIATDGSQKLPQRILDPALELIRGGFKPVALSMCLACWIQSLIVLFTSSTFRYSDPKMDGFAAVCDTHSEPTGLATGILPFLGLDFSKSDHWILSKEVVRALEILQSTGIVNALSALSSQMLTAHATE